MCMPNFNEISQSTAEIKLLPVSVNGRPPYRNSIFGWFRFWRMCSHWHVILHPFAKFRINLSIGGRVVTSYPFSRWRPVAILDLIWVMIGHPRGAIVALTLFLKFGLDPVYIFGDIAVLAWNCLFTPILGGLGAYLPRIWLLIVLTTKRTILPRKHVVWATKRENRLSGSTWA